MNDSVGDISVNGAEARLILRLIGRSVSEAGILDADLSGIDGEALLKLAARHRVLPQIYAGLKQANALDAIGAEAVARLRGYIQSNAGKVLRLAGELRRLVGEFESAQIPVIPFKGLVLAAQVYGDLSMRDVGDLDLLVRREDIIRAADLLVSLGHHPIFPTATPRETAYLEGLSGARRNRYLRWHCEHHLVYEPTHLNVDLHWAMSLREFSVSLDVDGIWSRAKRTNVAGREILTLGDEDLLIVLCLNGAKDCWERLDRVCDVAHLLARSGRTLAWMKVFKLAQDAGVARMLRVGLRLANGLLNAPLPDAAAKFVDQDREVERLTVGVCAALFEGDGATHSRTDRAAFDLRLRERWGDRAQYCLAHLRPGVGDWAAVPLPDSLSFLHYVIRPFRLAFRHLRPTAGHGM
ncbi:MAG TPA: nucleotidyltransferase family protein [Tepidisphaeraceae bacterium]|jgi:hypothetical protein